MPDVCSTAITAELVSARTMPMESLASSDCRFVRFTWSGSQFHRAAVMFALVEKALRTMT